MRKGKNKKVPANINVISINAVRIIPENNVKLKYKILIFLTYVEKSN